MTRHREHPIRITDGTFVIVASGVAEGPSQALRRFLGERGAARVIEISHPLVPEVTGEHVVTDWLRGSADSRRIRRRPNRPPLSYAFDPITPLRVPRSDAWFGFNCLATSQGLVQRSIGRTKAVVHWSVDFVPERFGPGLATKVYEAVDKVACRHADGRVDLSEAALDGRNQAYGLDDRAAPPVVVPMGAWLAESPRTAITNLERPRVVFLGHLVERMGVRTIVDAVAELRRRGVDIEADIIGGGPLLEPLRQMVSAHQLDRRVVVHGFVADFADVQAILHRAVIAVAPYERDPNSFSRFADPGKLKAYLAAGLPILLTDVPPNAAELVAKGGAEIVAADPIAFADGIAALLATPADWELRHRAALAHASEFDWSSLLDTKLTELGFDVGT